MNKKKTNDLARPTRLQNPMEPYRLSSTMQQVDAEQGTQQDQSSDVAPRRQHKLSVIFEGSIALPVILLGAVGWYLLTFHVIPTVRRISPNKTTPELNFFREIAKNLSLSMNYSLDPCRHFFRYTCYSYDSDRTPGAVFSSTSTTSNTLQTLPTTKSGRLLFAYYRSCLQAQFERANLAIDVTSAILPVKQASADMPFRDLFLMLVGLSLRYGIYGSVTVSQRHFGKLPGNVPFSWRVQTIAPLAKPQILFLLSGYSLALTTAVKRDVQKLRHDSLNIVNEALGTNVTMTQLDFITEDFLKHNTTPLRQSDTSTLNGLVSGISLEHWKAIVYNATGQAMSRTLVHIPFVTLQRRFSVFLDVRSQPSTIVFILVEAAVLMGSDVIREREKARHDLNVTFAYCLQEVYKLYPLWVLDDLESFSPDPDHDRVLINVFQSLVNTITTAATRVLHPKDISLLRKTLNSIQLLLPHDVVPLHTQLPTAAENFFLNKLRVREYRMTLFRYKPPPNISRDAVFSLGSMGAIKGEGFISITVKLYKTLRLGKHSPNFISMALVGFIVVDNIWKFVFHGQWSNATHEILATYEDCAKGDPNLIERNIERPELTLKSCVSAVRSHDWEELINVWGNIRLSPSQMFYILIVFYTSARTPARNR